MHGWLDGAILLKLKDNQGRFAARVVANLPFIIEAGLEVALVPPLLDGPRLVRIAQCTQKSETDYVISFEGVTQEEAACLVGKHCLFKTDQVIIVDSDEYSELVGFTMYDGKEPIGIVSGFIHNPAQSLIVGKTAEDEEFFVPYVDDFIVSIDMSNSALVLDLPVGLLDI